MPQKKTHNVLGPHTYVPSNLWLFPHHGALFVFAGKLLHKFEVFIVSHLYFAGISLSTDTNTNIGIILENDTTVIQAHAPPTRGTEEQVGQNCRLVSSWWHCDNFIWGTPLNPFICFSFKIAFEISASTSKPTNQSLPRYVEALAMTTVVLYEFLLNYEITNQYHQLSPRSAASPAANRRGLCCAMTSISRQQPGHCWPWPQGPRSGTIHNLGFHSLDKSSGQRKMRKQTERGTEPSALWSSYSWVSHSSNLTFTSRPGHGFGR